MQYEHAEKANNELEEWIKSAQNESHSDLLPSIHFEVTGVGVGSANNTLDGKLLHV